MSIPQGEQWTRAMASLQKIVPGASSFSPEAIAHAADAANKQVHWRRIPDFESLDDSDIWRFIKPTISTGADNAITLIADACFHNALGPIVTTNAELDTVIEDFVDHHDDEVFGGDVIIIFPSIVILVHHEGLTAELRR